MAKRSDVPRTVQFWRLVDARDGALVEEVNWDAVMRHLHGHRHTAVIDGREHAGTVVSLNVVEGWADALGIDDVPDAVPRENEDVTHGVVVAAGKDYVPNQENVASGSQKPMGLDGDNWSPVDNLFVWHLPFGNMIGVLAESTSSSKAGKYADWLTRATRSFYEDDPEFSWSARPVIDKARANLIKKANGLRSFVYAGEVGGAVNEATGAKAVFIGPNRKQPTALRIEIKASLVPGKSAPHDDEQVLLDWFTSTFGSLEGEVSKAQVALPASDDTPASEVDLLHHRLTRKVRVPLALGTTRAFTAMSAVGAIVDAFDTDRAELLKLRFNTD